MALPKLVIFDCDGVLVDSERIANEVMARFITDSGWPMTTDESMATFVGLRMSEVMATVERRTGKHLVSDWLEQFEAARDVAFGTRLKPVAGVAEVLDRLKTAGIKTCVASSGSHAKMQRTLGLTGLLSRLDGRLYSSTEVARGKPFPDIFLHAAESQGISPDRCVVIEDSPAGAQAAQGAGMPCFGYAADSDARALQAHGATVFFRMAELPALLGL